MQAEVFSSTQWSTVLRAGGESSHEARQALEKLCNTYWYPLYAYVRRQGHAPADAQDLTQDFFARFLERKYVRLATRERGRFRTFLLTSLKNFLVNAWNQSNALKRGGGQQIISLDQDVAEERFAAEPALQPPDALFDHRWATTLLDRALTRLREEAAEGGKSGFLDQVQPFVWCGQGTEGYAPTAERLGMTEGALKVAVHRLRQRFGELVRAEVAHTVATPPEVEEELRYLIAVVRTLNTRGS